MHKSFGWVKKMSVGWLLKMVNCVDFAYWSMLELV